MKHQIKQLQTTNRIGTILYAAFGSTMLLTLGLLLPGCGQNRADDVAAMETGTSVAASEPSPSELAAAAEQRALEAEARALAAETRAREAEAQALDRARQRELEERAIDAVSREQERRTRVLELRSDAIEPSRPAALPQPIEAPEPETIRVTLPAATPLAVEIVTALSSETNLIGDAVEAVVTRDVTRDGFVVVPAGSRLSGTVTDVAAIKKIGGQARLNVDFERLETLDGQVVRVNALLDSEARSQKKKDAATIGGSAAGGALLGRVLSEDDRSRGTVLGAIVGAAVGTAIAANNNADAVFIESGTAVELRLDAPVELAVNPQRDGEVYARN